MNRPRLLDAFCRKGGAAMGYLRAGFHAQFLSHLSSRRAA